jgi:hypothetical protein
MNPALALILIIAAVALWFLLSGLFKPIGNLIYRIGKDAIDIITEEENE